MTRSKKRRISEREDFEEMFRTSQSNRREIEDEDSLAVAISCAAVAIVSSRKSAAPRRPVINRQQQKERLALLTPARIFFPGFVFDFDMTTLHVLLRRRMERKKADQASIESKINN